jgi:hypothetical protein
MHTRIRTIRLPFQNGSKTNINYRLEGEREWRTEVFDTQHRARTRFTKLTLSELHDVEIDR